MIEFSIIIPCKGDSPYLRECLKNIHKQSFKNFEIIVLPDEPFSLVGVKVISLKSGPAQKRDLGAKNARGKYLAFIDDDAYPDKDWLKNSLKYFKSKTVAVGGPQLTPFNDSFSQKLSGFTFASRFVGGLRARYQSISFSFEVDDWPSVNFIVSKRAFSQVKGFDSNFYPGEDTKLCLDLINKGYKIIYAPDCVVYHHRRKGIKSHVKQVSNYGFHRGFFVKKFPKTSFKIQYFLPSLFFLFLIAGLFSFLVSNTIFNVFLILLSFFFIFCFIDGLIISKNFVYAIFLPFYIVLTHFFYGVYFIKGLLTRGLLR